MGLWLFFAFDVLAVILLIVVSMKPDRFSVERSINIAAPPEKIFPLIDDFHQWTVWSPWEKLDPALRRTYSGAPRGQGAIYAWEGNKKVGSGRMEITESVPSSKEVIQLDFLKPFEAHNVAELTLEPIAGGTYVSWRMHGAQPFMLKLMSVFMSMDKMVGKDFEAGLANLRAAAEK